MVRHTTMLLSPDELFAVSCGVDALATFRIEDETIVGETTGPGRPESIVGASDDVFAVAWWADGAPTLTAHGYGSPGEILSSIQPKPGGQVHVTGAGEVWRSLPPLCAIAKGWTVVVLWLAEEPALLPFPTPRFEGLDDPEWGLAVVACPDARHLLVQGAHYGRLFVVWDAIEQEEVTRIELGGYPAAFRFRDDGRELWAGHLDTLSVIDTSEWTVTTSRRLRADRSGSFIHDMQFDRSEARLLISWSRRRPIRLFDLSVPHGASALVLDAEEFSISHVAHHPTWLGDAVLLSDGRCVARCWGRDEPFVVLAPTPARHALYPPRPAGAADWM